MGPSAQPGHEGSAHALAHSRRRAPRARTSVSQYEAIVGKWARLSPDVRPEKLDVLSGDLESYRGKNQKPRLQDGSHRRDLMN